MWLLDGNVLVALAIDSHEFHKRAHRWFDPLSESFATCAVTEGTLLRLHMRLAADGRATAAWAVLAAHPSDARPRVLERRLQLSRDQSYWFDRSEAGHRRLAC